jgi:hypothetical protein
VLNPNVHTEPYPVDLDEANAAAIVIGHDIVLDFSGTAAGLADACATHGVELVCAEGTGTVAGVLAAEAALTHLTARVPAGDGA